MAALKELPGYLPVGPAHGRVFDRLEALKPKVLAGHHAPAFTGDAVQALRDLRRELFKFAGMAVEEVAEGSTKTLRERNRRLASGARHGP